MKEDSLRNLRVICTKRQNIVRDQTSKGYTHRGTQIVSSLGSLAREPHIGRCLVG